MKKTIAILFGGCSPEYQVSLQSAYAVITHINTDLYTPVLIGISRQGSWYFYDGPAGYIPADSWNSPDTCTPVLLSFDQSNSAFKKQTASGPESIHIDAAFPVLHGQKGEDGTVQGMLELAGIPVIGCGPLSSALCMDKYRAHQLVKSAGIAVPESVLLSKDTPIEEISSLAAIIGYPIFMKPVRAGSSFGISKIHNASELPKALKNAFSYDDAVILEETITGFEVGCAIIGKDRLTIGEVDKIELAQEFFDYEEKYTLKSSQIYVPAPINPRTADAIKETAGKIYHILGCDGFARVDMFLTESGKLVFNEVNTIPGFTSHSRFPNMLKAAGMTFEQILDTIIREGMSK
ncbi:MAG: D-alanine--D-serine ligase VanG [Parasporobacterium sp.]|nr:D-alanine--D-serine ligase VanG [Parasporobacterium sp.]